MVWVEKKKLAQDKGQCQDFVKTVMKLHVPYKAGNNSTRRVAVGV